MYHDGTISGRLREAQRETNAALARVSHLSELLAQGYTRIKELECSNLLLAEHNKTLQSLLDSKNNQSVLLEETAPVSDSVETLLPEIPKPKAKAKKKSKIS